jgi:methionine-rich copper-binding protein CopC
MSIPRPNIRAIVPRSSRTTRTSRAAFAIVTSVVLALLVVAPVALGHAQLATVDPADKSTVQGSPTEIVMTFTQNLDPSKSSIRVVNAGGAVVAQGGTVPSGSPREMDLALTNPLDPGKYTIRWTTFSSEDQEQARGTTTFTVVAAPPSATPAPSLATAAPSAPPSSSPSVAPSIPPVVSAPPSSPPTTPATSTSDAVIPVVLALIVLAGLGLWLLRGRSRSSR